MSKPLDIYMIAIGGTGMAPLACLLAEAGHRVRGSDGPLYPPMSDLLAEAGIEPLVGADPAHLEPRPDLVIVGNAVHRHHPEAVRVEESGIERISMPQALWRFVLAERRPLVISGTHGKTTTTSMAAWVYERSGHEPGYLIGGAPIDLPTSFCHGSGERFILEGDEYNAAYFDREAKFLHYHPQTLIVTGVEYDHADLYPDPQSVEAAFAKLIAGLPTDGHLIGCGDCPTVRRLVRTAPCRVTLYGYRGEDLQTRIVEATPGSRGTRVVLRDERDGEVEIELSVWGRHNAANAAAVWCAARADELPPAVVREALEGFRGVRRRLEIVGTPGDVVVVDDFAHHPTEVRASLEGLAQRFPSRPLVALFEPRSLTAGRKFLLDAYVEAFRLADRVALAPIYHAARLQEEERLDREALARRLSELGVRVELFDDVEELLRRALVEARPGEVLVSMSSGSFAGMPRRLLEGLQARAVHETAS